MSDKQEFLDMLKGLKSVDITKTPCIRFKTLLLGRLLRDNIPAAPVLVGNMKVEVSEAFINDDELVDASVDTYAAILSNTWRCVLNMPMSQPDQLVFFVEMMKGLTLSYTC